MDIEQIRALYDQDQRRNDASPGMRREAGPQVVRYVNLWDTNSYVLYTQLDATTVDTAIQEQIAYFAGLGHAFEWKVYSHDQPPDLIDRLVAQGFEAEDPEAIMVLDVADPPAALLQPVTLDIRRLTDPDHLEDVRAVEAAVWADDDRDWLLRQLSEELHDDPTLLSIFAAYAGGVPVSVGWIRHDPRGQWAGLWGGSTLAAYRGQGFYTALLAVRLQEARARNVRYLTVDASPMSRPILEKHGFQRITTAVACIWHPPEPEV